MFNLSRRLQQTLEPLSPPDRITETTPCIVPRANNYIQKQFPTFDCIWHRTDAEQTSQNKFLFVIKNIIIQLY